MNNRDGSESDGEDDGDAGDVEGGDISHHLLWTQP